MAEATPKYYWLKLMNDFFYDKRIKKLRKSGGDTAVIIYLKMLLKAMRNAGYIEFEGLEDNFFEELALDFDEDEEICKNALETLEKCALVETANGKTYFLPDALTYTGSESEAAERMRKKRKDKAEQKNNISGTNLNNVQNCSNNVQECSNNVRKCYIEKEKDIEKDSEIYSEKDEEDSAASAEINLRLRDEKNFSVFKSDIKKWTELYPDVNIEQELRSMNGWLEANPDMRKARAEMPRFINAWLTRKQENPPPATMQNKISGEKPKKNGYISDAGASYDLEAAIEKMNKSVPKLPPKKKKIPALAAE